MVLNLCCLLLRQTPTLLLTPSPLLPNIHFWSTLSPVAPLSPATRRQGAHLFQVSILESKLPPFSFFLLSFHFSVLVWKLVSALTLHSVLFPSFRLSSPLSSRFLYIVWMGPTHLAPFPQTLRRHRNYSPTHTHRFNISPFGHITTRPAASSPAPHAEPCPGGSWSLQCFTAHGHSSHTTIRHEGRRCLSNRGNAFSLSPSSYSLQTLFLYLQTLMLLFLMHLCVHFVWLLQHLSVQRVQRMKEFLWHLLGACGLDPHQRQCYTCTLTSGITDLNLSFSRFSFFLY